MSTLLLRQHSTTPGTPAASNVILYQDTNKNLGFVDDGGNVRTLATDNNTLTLANKTLTTPVLGVATGTSLAVTGALTTSSPSAKFGYATGAGGAVTQLSSKSNAVTLDKICGQITMAAATLTAGGEAAFTLNNSTIAATDTVAACFGTNGGNADTDYLLSVTAVAAGSCVICVSNVSTTSRANSPIINFAVLKGVTS